MLMLVSQLPITGSAHKAANGRRPLPAATGTAPSARAPPRAPGWPSARPTCCRSDTSTSGVSRFPPKSADIAFHNKAVAGMTCCSGRRQRPCSPSPLTGVILVRALASPPCSTPGDRRLTHHPHIHMIVPGGRHLARRSIAGYVVPAGLSAAGPQVLLVETVPAGCSWRGCLNLHTAGQLAFFG